MSPETLERATGRTTTEFEDLLLRFDASWKTRYDGRTITGENRRRKRGGGHWTVLASTQAKLFFILFYNKFRPTQEVMALIYGLSQGQVSHWISRLTPVAVKIPGGASGSAPRKPANLAQLFRDVPELLDIIKELSVTDDQRCRDQPAVRDRRTGKIQLSDRHRTGNLVSAGASTQGAETCELDGRAA